MKVITIVPQNLLGYTEGEEMHMALAQFFGEPDMAEYYNFFRREAKAGKYIIMDNGAAETGCCHVDQLIRAAHFVGASEIIVPDVLCDADQTLENAFEFIPVIREKCPGMKIMAVAQGSTLEEWYDCAVELLKADIDVLGVPKVLTKRFNDPHARVKVLERLSGLARGVEIHLLGCNESPLEARTIENYMRQDKMFPRVRSIDSALPYVYAMNNMRIVDAARPSGTVDFRTGTCTANQLELLEQNIRTWRHDCNLDPAKTKVTTLY